MADDSSQIHIGGFLMSHHLPIIIDGIEYGYFRICNDGQILSVWVHQPWGVSELFIPEQGYREPVMGEEE